MVSKVLAGPRPEEAAAATAPAADAPSAPPTAADDVADAEALVAGGTTSEGELRASLARLQKAGRLAESDKDVARVVSVERVSMQIVQLLEKLKPVPVADPNEQPDMVAAAARFRERVHAVLDRILAGVPK